MGNKPDSTGQIGQNRGTMTDATQRPELPDHLSIDPRSPHHVAAIFEHDIGIRFNGAERNNVEEYCISEGWIRCAVGTSLDRRGKPITLQYRGTVEPYFKE